MISTPWLFAIAAVVFVLAWRGMAALSAPVPHGIPRPPLPPVPPAPCSRPAETRLSLPPLPGPAPVEGGMNPLLLAAVIAPWGLLAWSHLAPRPTPAPDIPPSPPPVVDLDLRGVFVGPHAAEDAAITHQLLADLAHAISVDGSIDFDGDDHIDPPRLTTGQQLAELRRTARAYRTDGVSLADRQPKAIERISAYLETTVGTNGGPLDAAAKQKWVDGFLGVSKAAAAALGR